MQAQGQLQDLAQPAARAGEELGQVVAGHGLHDPAAGSGDRAVGEPHRHPQHEVAGRAVAVRARPERCGRERLADPQAGRARRIEREHLAAAGEHRLQLREGHVGADGAGEIARLVLDHHRSTPSRSAGWRR